MKTTKQRQVTMRDAFERMRDAIRVFVEMGNNLSFAIAKTLLPGAFLLLAKARWDRELPDERMEPF